MPVACSNMKHDEMSLESCCKDGGFRGLAQLHLKGPNTGIPGTAGAAGRHEMAKTARPSVALDLDELLN